MIAGWWRLVSNPVEPFPGEEWSWGTMPWLLAVCWAPCLLPQHLQAAQLSLQELVFLPALCCWSWSFLCCCLPQTNVYIFLNKMWNPAVLPVFRGDRWLVHWEIICSPCHCSLIFSVWTVVHQPLLAAHSITLQASFAAKFHRRGLKPPAARAGGAWWWPELKTMCCTNPGAHAG